jgi:hypothetical protein
MQRSLLGNLATIPKIRLVSKAFRSDFAARSSDEGRAATGAFAATCFPERQIIVLDVGNCAVMALPKDKAFPLPAPRWGAVSESFALWGTINISNHEKIKLQERQCFLREIGTQTSTTKGFASRNRVAPLTSPLGEDKPDLS